MGYIQVLRFIFFSESGGTQKHATGLEKARKLVNVKHR